MAGSIKIAMQWYGVREFARAASANNEEARERVADWRLAQKLLPCERQRHERLRKILPFVGERS